MTSSLYLTPLVDRIGKPLSITLKRILGPKYWDHDGSLSGDEVHLTADDVPYLEGLRDGLRDGLTEEPQREVQQILQMIAKFGGAVIWIAN